MDRKEKQKDRIGAKQRSERAKGSLRASILPFRLRSKVDPLFEAKRAKSFGTQDRKENGTKVVLQVDEDLVG